MKQNSISIKILFTLVVIILICTILFNGCSDIMDNIKPNAEQWALNNTGQVICEQSGSSNIDINVMPVWEKTHGSKNVLLGILDTGIEDTAGLPLYINEKEIPNNGIDDDANGYIDDISGWDFYNSDNSTFDKYINDYHGTYIANTIAGNQNNLLGVAPGLTIVPLKFMQGTSGDVSRAIEAIEYAHKLGIKIINCSWNIPIFNQDLYDVIKKYNDILFVCATGNECLNLDKTPIYPASYDLENVISVMAIDNRGVPYDCSGYGKTVSLAAPGVNIISNLPDGDVDYISGTSIAAAFVSAAAGLLISYDSSLSPKQVKELLIKNVSKTNSLSEYTEAGGYLNVYDALISI